MAWESSTDIFGKFDWLIKKTKNLLGRVYALENAGGGYTPPYSVYTALLTQSGTNPPTATVLENTLGVSITWGYGSLGNYNTNYITGNINKVAIFCSQGSSPVSYSILSYANPDGPTVAFNIQTLANYTGAFIGAIGPNNGLLSNAFVEIRVYN